MMTQIQSTFKNRLAGIKGIVWDLDNTLYRLDDAMTQAFHTAIGKAVIEAGVDLDLETTVALAKKSFEEFGYSGRIFVRDYGIDDEWLHHKFHGYINETLITKSMETVDMFRRTDLRHALITHGSAEWARRVLQHLGLSQYFCDDCIQGLENYRYEKKSESALSFTQALKMLELKAEETVFVEDTPHNLTIPHRMGMGTVLIHYGQPPNDLPPHIDAHYDNALELLRHVLQQKNLPTENRQNLNGVRM
jgi:putative hydrolase of the HAD superfamily